MKIHFLRRKRYTSNSIHEETVTCIEGLSVPPLSFYGAKVYVDGVRYDFDRFNQLGDPVFISHIVYDELVMNEGVK